MAGSQPFLTGGSKVTGSLTSKPGEVYSEKRHTMCVALDPGGDVYPK